MRTTDEIFSQLACCVDSQIAQYEKDKAHLIGIVRKIEAHGVEDTPIMSYRPLSREGTNIVAEGYAILGLFVGFSSAGMTSKNRPFIDIRLGKGTKFGFLYGSDGIIDAYKIPNSNMEITADFSVLVGAEEIMPELRKLNVMHSDIHNYLEDAGLAVPISV